MQWGIPTSILTYVLLVHISSTLLVYKRLQLLTERVLMYREWRRGMCIKWGRQLRMVLRCILVQLMSKMRRDELLGWINFLNTRGQHWPKPFFQLLEWQSGVRTLMEAGQLERQCIDICGMETCCLWIVRWVQPSDTNYILVRSILNFGLNSFTSWKRFEQGSTCLLAWFWNNFYCVLSFSTFIIW